MSNPIKRSVKGKKTNNRKGGNTTSRSLANVARTGGEIPLDPQKAGKKALRKKTVTGRNTGGNEKPAKVNTSPTKPKSNNSSVVRDKRNRKQTYGDK